METRSMIKFNVGCGKRNWPGWVNIDGNGMPHLHGYDVTLKYEPDNYIDLLYSSHLIAYFDRTEALELLSGWFKKIKPGGTLRVATPDFEILSKMHQVGVDLDRLLGPMYGRMPMGKETIYHRTVWDERSLSDTLKVIGFINVRRYDHSKTLEHPNTGNREDFFDDQSAAYINQTLISLNLEANKPL